MASSDSHQAKEHMKSDERAKAMKLPEAKKENAARAEDVRVK
jgi:hypothetical protein